MDMKLRVFLVEQNHGESFLLEVRFIITFFFLEIIKLLLSRECGVYGL